jgi:hypothetical protein
MSEDPNQLAAFAALLDRHGGSLDAWPPAERPFAEALLRSSAVARRQFAAAGAVDGALAELMQPGPELRLANPAEYRPHAHRASPWRLASWSSAALAASIAFGFALGTIVPPQDEDDPGTIVFASVQDADLGDAP